MLRLGEWLVKHTMLVLLAGILLMIPSALGYLNTRVNYDILSYLPKDINTMKGQDILIDEFGKGGFSFVMLDGMSAKDVRHTADEISKIDGVAEVLCYESLTDSRIPREMLPDKINNFLNKGDTTMIAVFFSEGTSANITLEAIDTMRKITSKQCFISGMSAITTDMKHITESEMLIYGLIAVVLTSIVLFLTMDSLLIPVLFMLSIGFAVVWNLGSNFFLGEISFITQSLALVLQLGVTMDYSIFLWHSYKEQLRTYGDDKDAAMAHAIANTVGAVVSSSFTTVAGFLAMCVMSFTLGLDLGIVMAKGVVFGVVACVTVLPAMILLFDKAIMKTTHKVVLPTFQRISGFIVNHSFVFLTAAIALLIPAFFGYKNFDVYYNLDSTLPEHFDSVIANEKLTEEYGMNSTHMLLVDASMSAKDAVNMMNEMNKVQGVEFTLGYNTLVGPSIPDEFIPDSLKSTLKSENWQLMLIGSEYQIATDEVNTQITKLNDIVQRYDKNALLIGEAPATKDLIEITDHDFKIVSLLSIAVIFLIIAINFRSLILPMILVSVIELAIFINLGIAFFTNTTLPFVASVVIGTIQLGATVDYAILMTTRYRTERSSGKEKKESVTIALRTSMQSVITSALGFFAATIGVSLFSDIGMISSLCMLLARGALISMAIVITVLPSMFMVFDKVICKTSAGFLPKKEKEKQQLIPAASH